ncbi:uncharacterized protein IUM83_03743 [Phytophthora cinnamomi]|uniref:uncharacterized protein n=1 Tax=Phytophthora cinnamomi TaxID=4785 RepID=UPI003559CA8C|nr:hypothetical protein IUM83_03743 [Phytophthora cinnamomi]
MVRKSSANAAASPGPQEVTAATKTPKKTAKDVHTTEQQSLAMVECLEVSSNYKIIVGESTSGKGVSHDVGVTKIEGFKRMAAAVNRATISSMKKAGVYDATLAEPWAAQSNVEPNSHTTAPVSEESGKDNDDADAWDFGVDASLPGNEEVSASTDEEATPARSNITPPSSEFSVPDGLSETDLAADIVDASSATATGQAAVSPPHQLEARVAPNKLPYKLKRMLHDAQGLHEFIIPEVKHKSLVSIGTLYVRPLPEVAMHAHPTVQVLEFIKLVVVLVLVEFVELREKDLAKGRSRQRPKQLCTLRLRH